MDELSFRRDVLALVRYPVGNFVSGYLWEDDVGPKDRRLKRLDLAWMTLENDQVGTGEFAEWAQQACAQ